ncbi:Inositol polyphosphate 5-phosphatase OCRL-1, partial [Leucoagaricus sp. SymC.cos]
IDCRRRPAWTDRILHVSGSTCSVQQHSYDSYAQITMSDHRPVAANFSVEADLYKKLDFESAVRSLYREAYSLDGSYERPIIKVDKSFVDFGEIRYDSHLTQNIIFENVGKIPCAWRFVSPPDSPIHPDWLSVEPMTGMFLPGEKTEISLIVQLDKRITSLLNLGPRDMSGTLILHTVLGKDHFIAISGDYLPSCFGNKLSTLIRLPGPIRSLTSSKELRGENHPLNAPGEVMRLVNRLLSSTQPPEDLFLQPPEEEMFATIRECLDTGDEFPWLPGEAETEAKALHAFAHTLLRLLDSLIEPIVPPILHSRCVEMASRDEAFELLDALQPAAVNVWITVTAFLHFICQSSKISGYAEKIADIFAAVLMRDDPDSTTPPISPIGKRNFFLQFIT